jgi:hypothetical protein
MERRLGEGAIVLGGVLCIIGSHGRWSSVAGYSDSAFANGNERWLVLACGCLLIVAGALAALSPARARSPRLIAVVSVWSVAIAVGLAIIDTAKKIDKVEDIPLRKVQAHVGWGMWLVGIGAVVALLGLLGELVDRWRDENELIEASSSRTPL